MVWKWIESIAKIGIEDANFRPIGLLPLDEFQVARRCLIGVVRRAIFENGVQNDVEVHVDRAVVFGLATPHREIDQTWMVGQIGLAVIQQRVDGFIAAVFGREENLVCESRHRIARIGGGAATPRGGFASLIQAGKRGSTLILAIGSIGLNRSPAGRTGWTPWRVGAAVLGADIVPWSQ